MMQQERKGGKARLCGWNLQHVGLYPVCCGGRGVILFGYLFLFQVLNYNYTSENFILERQLLFLYYAKIF